MGLVNVKANFTYTPPEPVYPEINSVTLKAVSDELREGQENVKTGTKVATVSIDGGTKPYQVELTEGNDKFEATESEIKCTQDLTAGEYNLTLKVTDSQSKEKEETLQLKVLPAVVKVSLDDLSDEIEAIKTEYYNKYKEKTIHSGDSEFKKDKLYVEIGDAEEAESITLGEEEFGKEEDLKISIGNNSFIESPAFIVDAGKLKINPFYLLILSSEGKINVKCNDKLFEVSLSAPSTKTLTIGEVVHNTESDRKNEVNQQGSKITQVSNNGRHAFGLIINDDQTPITEAETLVYIYSESEKKIGITLPEKLNNKDVTFVRYMKWKDGDYDDEDVTTINENMKVFINGKGIIDVEVDFTAEKYEAE